MSRNNIVFKLSYHGGLRSRSIPPKYLDLELINKVFYVENTRGRCETKSAIPGAQFCNSYFQQ